MRRESGLPLKGGARWKRSAWLPLLLILTALAGCAVWQRTDPYAPVRAGARTSAIGGYPPGGEPRAAAAPLEGPLTLERCVELALANNPELAATVWDAAAAVGRLDQARASEWPTVTLEGNTSRFLDPQRLIQARYNGERGSFDRDIHRADVVLKLPLFAGGRIVNEIAAADLIRQAEEHRLGRTREELIFNVSSVFYAILGQRKVIHSLEFSIEAMEEHLKQVSALFAAQKAAKVDVLRTEVRLADLRQILVKEQNVLAVQKRVLANLMGLDYVTERFPIEGKLTFEGRALDAAPLIDLAMNRREDYLAARARLEAQARKVDVARAGHWPTVTLLGTYGVRADSLGDEEDVGSIGLGVSVPLFEGGRVMAKVDEERRLLAAAQERLRKLELQIRQDVETAVLDVRSSGERARALEKSIEQAKESLRIERQKYDLGMGSMMDVLDAQSALLASETAYYRALADFRTALARLDLATGGAR